MPLYLDTHNKVEGLTEEMIAEAHAADLATQGKYGVTYYRYWFDESTGRVYCLFEAPDASRRGRPPRGPRRVADVITEVREGV